MIITKEHRCDYSDYSGIMITRDAVRHFRNAWCTICGKTEEQARIDVVGSLWLKGTDDTEEEQALPDEEVKP